MSEVRRRPEGNTTTEVLASSIRGLRTRLDRLERRLLAKLAGHAPSDHDHDDTYVPRSGGTFTGEIIGNGGLYTPFDPADPADLPSAYPRGSSVGTGLASQGWPTTGTIVSHKRSDARMLQWFAGNNGDLYVRMTSATDTWTAWKQVAFV